MLIIPVCIVTVITLVGEVTAATQHKFEPDFMLLFRATHVLIEQGEFRVANDVIAVMRRRYPTAKHEAIADSLKQSLIEEWRQYYAPFRPRHPPRAPKDSKLRAG